MPTTILTTEGLNAITSAGVMGPYFAIKYFLPIYDARIDAGIHGQGVTSAINTSACETSSTSFANVHGERLYNTTGYTITSGTSFCYFDGSSISAVGGSSFQVSSTGTSGSKQHDLDSVNLYNNLPISKVVSGDFNSSPSPGVFLFNSGSSAIAQASMPVFDISTTASRALVYDVVSFTPSVFESSSKGLFKCRLDEVVGNFKFNKVVLFAVKTNGSGVEDTSQPMIPLAYTCIENPIVKAYDGFNISNVEIDVELSFTVSGGSDLVYNNTEYWARTISSGPNAGALSFTGDVALASSAYPGTWYTSGTKLRITNDEKWALEISKDGQEGVKIQGYSTSADGWGSGDGRGLRFSRFQVASGLYSSATGQYTVAIGDGSKAGNISYAPGYSDYALAFGYGVSAVGNRSFALGYGNYAFGSQSFSFGSNCSAVGNIGNNEYSFALGSSAVSRDSSIAIGGMWSVIPTCASTNSIALGHGSNAVGNTSFAAGGYCIADGQYSIALGYGIKTTGMGAQDTPTRANGTLSIAIGYETSANGLYSISIGAGTKTLQTGSIAVGTNVYNNSTYSLAMGRGTSATGGSDALAIGTSAVASSTMSLAIGKEVFSTTNSLALGWFTSASGNQSVAIGYESYTFGTDDIAIGRTTSAYGYESIAIGHHSVAGDNNCIAIGTDSYSGLTGNDNAISIGVRTSSNGFGAISLGWYTYSVGNHSIAMGRASSSTSFTSIAMGEECIAGANNAYSQGLRTSAIGEYSHATGYSSYSTASYSLGHGDECSATAPHSVSIGYKSISNGYHSTAIGRSVSAIGNNSIALGEKSASVGLGSFAFGVAGYGYPDAYALGAGSFAMGLYTSATGIQSFAFGNDVIAAGEFTVAIGKTITSTSVSSSFVFGVAVGSAKHNTVVMGKNSGVTGGTGQYGIAIGNTVQVEGNHFAIGTDIYSNNSINGYNISLGFLMNRGSASGPISSYTSATTMIGATIQLNPTSANSTEVSLYNSTIVGYDVKIFSNTRAQYSSIIPEKHLLIGNNLVLGSFTGGTDANFCNNITLIGNNLSASTSTAYATSASYAFGQKWIVGRSDVHVIGNGLHVNSTGLVYNSTLQTVIGSRYVCINHDRDNSFSGVDSDGYKNSLMYFRNSNVTPLVTSASLIPVLFNIGSSFVATFAPATYASFGTSCDGFLRIWVEGQGIRLIPYMTP